MCAGSARYLRGDGDRLRRSSRDTVDGSLPIARAIARTPSLRSRRHAISSRSPNVSRLPGTTTTAIHHSIPQSP
jgi:hypothetical protein